MDLEDFGSIFGTDGDVSYSRSAQESIKQHRSQLGGELFIDRLFRHIKLDSASKLYPPKSHKELKELFKEIVSSSRPTHDQHSLVYYLIRDLKSRTRDPLNFADKVALPKQYQIFMDGLWFLDRLKFEDAVERLTEPMLTPTFPEEILGTLLRHGASDTSLALAYYNVVEPNISDTEVLDLLMDAMCQSSLTEAFFASRSYDGWKRRHLFEGILSYVHSREAGPARANLGVELVSLPLDENEEQWQEEFLLSGEGQQLPSAGDTMIMRQIAMGRTAEAARLASNMKSRKADGLDWRTLTQSLQQQ